MSRSRTYEDSLINVRDVETGELLQARWRDWTVSTEKYGGKVSGKGSSEAWLVEGNEELNSTDDPRRFNGLFSGRVVELVEEV